MIHSRGASCSADAHGNAIPTTDVSVFVDAPMARTGAQVPVWRQYIPRAMGARLVVWRALHLLSDAPCDGPRSRLVALAARRLEAAARVEAAARGVAPSRAVLSHGLRQAPLLGWRGEAHLRAASARGTPRGGRGCAAAPIAVAEAEP